MVLPISGLYACRTMLFEDADIGRDSAQIIGFELPFEETLVKSPPSWLATIGGDWAIRVSAGVGGVCSFQTSTWLLPLLTTRAAPSFGSTKYDSPHQQGPIP